MKSNCNIANLLVAAREVLKSCLFPLLLMGALMGVIAISSIVSLYTDGRSLDLGVARWTGSVMGTGCLVAVFAWQLRRNRSVTLAVASIFAFSTVASTYGMWAVKHYVAMDDTGLMQLFWPANTPALLRVELIPFQIFLAASVGIFVRVVGVLGRAVLRGLCDWGQELRDRAATNEQGKIAPSGANANGQ
jgi:hypothetical protein